MAERMDDQEGLCENSPEKDERKVFNDPVHGHIDLHPLCVRIINTPQFQRLRFLKQLGNCYFVYPGASHNRFEHSIGVCFLAGQLVRALQKRQPELDIDDKDVLCVEIAGLCHDLGHGPFSHLYDGKFIPAVRPDKEWKHEDASKELFGNIYESRLKEHFKKCGLGDEDKTFIEEQIAGRLRLSGTEGLQYEGRGKDKSFLYEIVANKRNGIDVDKWDYFARDCHMLGIKNNFDHNRCIQFTRVIEVEGEKQICARDKEADNLYGMFHTRSTLHRRAYQHRVTNIIDTMVVEAMILANDHITFNGMEGNQVKMSDAIDDMEAFIKMTDNVFFQILHSTDDNLADARTLLQDILERKLYKFVGQIQLGVNKKIKKGEENRVEEEIFCEIDEDESTNTGFQRADITITLANFDYWMDGNNPIDNVRFYRKNNPDEAIKMGRDEVSLMLPEVFAEQHLRVFCKKREQGFVNMVKKAFKKWCQRKGYPSPK